MIYEKNKLGSNWFSMYRKKRLQTITPKIISHPVFLYFDQPIVQASCIVIRILFGAIIKAKGNLSTFNYFKRNKFRFVYTF